MRGSARCRLAPPAEAPLDQIGVVAEKLDVARSQTIQAREGIGVKRAAEPRPRLLGELPLLAIIKGALTEHGGQPALAHLGGDGTEAGRLHLRAGLGWPEVDLFQMERTTVKPVSTNGRPSRCRGVADGLPA